MTKEKLSQQEQSWVEAQPGVGSLDREIQNEMMEEARAHVERIACEMRALYRKKYGTAMPRRLNPVLRRKALSLYVRFFWINITALRRRAAKWIRV